MFKVVEGDRRMVFFNCVPHKGR